jgi:hypothetical protein
MADAIRSEPVAFCAKLQSWRLPTTHKSGRESMPASESSRGPGLKDAPNRVRQMPNRIGGVIPRLIPNKSVRRR